MSTSSRRLLWSRETVPHTSGHTWIDQRRRNRRRRSSRRRTKFGGWLTTTGICYTCHTLVPIGFGTTSMNASYDHLSSTAKAGRRTTKKGGHVIPTAGDHKQTLLNCPTNQSRTYTTLPGRDTAWEIPPDDNGVNWFMVIASVLHFTRKKRDSPRGKLDRARDVDRWKFARKLIRARTICVWKTATERSPESALTCWAWILTAPENLSQLWERGIICFWDLEHANLFASSGRWRRMVCVAYLCDW